MLVEKPLTYRVEDDCSRERVIAVTELASRDGHRRA
jgi:hypothetical protein